MEDLQVALSGLSEEERNAAESAIFNTVSLKGWHNIAASGVDTIRELAKELGLSIEDFEGLGTASGMAATQNEGLTETWNRMSNSLTQLGTIVVQQVQPWLNWFIGGVESLVDWFMELDEAWQSTIFWLGTVVGGFTPVLVVVGSVISAIGGLITILGSISVPVLAVVAVLATLGGAIYTLWQTNEEFRENMTAIWNRLAKTFWSAVDRCKKVLGDLGFSVESTTDFITDTWAGFANWLQPYIEKTFDFIVFVIEGALHLVATYFENFSKHFKGDWTDLGNVVSAAWNALWDTMKPVVEEWWETWLKPKLEEWGEWFIGFMWNTLWAGIAQWWEDLKVAVGNWLNDILDPIELWFSNAWQTCKNWANKFWEVGKGIVDGIWKGIQSAWNSFTSSLFNLMRTTLPGIVCDALGIQSPSKLFADIGKFLPMGLAEGFEEAMPLAIKNMQSALDAGMGLLAADAIDFDYAFAPVKSRSGGGGGWQDEMSGGSNTPGGGNTYQFYSPEPIDAAQARREMEQLNRNLAFGF